LAPPALSRRLLPLQISHPCHSLAASHPEVVVQWQSVTRLASARKNCSASSKPKSSSKAALRSKLQASLQHQPLLPLQQDSQRAASVAVRSHSNHLRPLDHSLHVAQLLLLRQPVPSAAVVALLRLLLLKPFGKRNLPNWN
jgi:hypothetical protein